MNKKLFTGILLGSAVTGAAWQLLDEDKKKAIRDAIDQKLSVAADLATNYALNALDIVDEKLAETEYSDKFNNVTISVKNATDKAKQKADQLVDHLTNDDFDKQTADIREELANESQENDDNSDILIDTTDDKAAKTDTADKTTSEQQ